MSLSNIQNQGGPIGTPGLPKTQKTTKRVADIILNKDHAAYTGPDSIGIIFFTDEKTKEYANDPTTLPRAKPLSLNNFTTPLIGELVNIIQSTSDDYYPDLGGNSNFTSNYYTPAINVYNNAGSNAVPLDKRIGKGNKKSKTDQSEPTFEFQKEFRTSGAQEVASKMCGNYLRDLGYPSGRSDPRAPTYNLWREENGDYTLRLEDSEENKVKLGSYYKENPNQKNLNLTEGGTVNQGKAGQRISFSANNKPHSEPGSGLGGLEQNRAMVLSLGDGENENINDDDGTIHLATNQKVNIKTSSDLIASLHSEYKPFVEPLEQIEKIPAIAIPTTNPTPELQVEDHFSGLRGTVTEAASTTILTTDEDPFSDPVFDALDEAIDEGLITEEPVENYEISGTEADPAIESDPNNDIGKEPTDIIIEYQNTGGYNAIDIIDNMDPDLKDKSYRKNNRDKINKDSVAAWKGGNYAKAAFTNKLGAIILLPPPDPNLTMNRTETRNIEYLMIHCTAGHNTRTPPDTLRGHLKKWDRGGYHWMVMTDGVATRCYPDDKMTYGASGMNPKTIHLNWIGGFNKKWGYRDMTGNPIPKKYNDDGEQTNKNYAGKQGVSESLGVSEKQAYRRLYGFGSKNLEGWNGGDASTRNGNLISQPQVFTLYKLIKRYIETYPNIKVIGHNQAAHKNCPLFDVPTFMKLKFGGNNTEIGKVRGNYYHPYRLSLIENAEFIADSIS